jgi:two-component system response regulator HydG
VQVKLLRVLQEGEIERLGGGGRSRPIDIRLIAATHVDLSRAVQSGSFREDLYYRLNVVPVHVPPLRDRRDDITLLVQHFVQIYSEKNGKSLSGCSRRALELLSDYAWPGNVRELENAIERAVVLSRGNVLGEDDLPREVREAVSGGHVSGQALTFAVGTPLADIEMRVIQETLKRTKGDKRLAAKLLGIATRTIYRRLEAERRDDSDDELGSFDDEPDADVDGGGTEEG